MGISKKSKLTKPSKSNTKSPQAKTIKKKKTLKVKIEAPSIKVKNDVKPEVKEEKDVKLLPVKKKKLNKSQSFDKRNQATKAITALLQVLSKSQNKTALFEDGQPIFLQINCFKVPKCSKRFVRFNLKHSLITSTSDVCLFVPDLKRGRHVDHEPTVEFYESLLREKNIGNIKGIIPMRQVKTEYDQYEMKRRLLATYDHFLADSRITGHLSHLLGKKFVDKRKQPTPVRMTDLKKLPEEFDKAMMKTPMLVHGHGDTHLVQVALSSMKLMSIVDNIEAVLQQLDQLYPGGFANVRKLMVKSEKSIALPFYVSLKSPNDVKIPVVRPKRLKTQNPVKGELTTIPGSTVKVFPSGKVVVNKPKGQRKSLRVKK